MATHPGPADHRLLGLLCSLRPRLFRDLLLLLWTLLSCDLRGTAQVGGERALEAHRNVDGGPQLSFWLTLLSALK